MDTEIELKVFVLASETENLKKHFDNLPNSEVKPVKTLHNCYYDTVDLTLRRLKMGLRVRSGDELQEQTIKTAGKVVGGIHSRPEFNVDIDSSTPQLLLFPAAIWPADVDVKALQDQISPLFDTNFTRYSWHISRGDSRVEVALDIGQIISGDAQEPICELEFELLSGDTMALVELASEVAASFLVRLGKASKAQRGYRLAAAMGDNRLDALSFIALPSSHSLNDTLMTLLETGLERWQLLEDMLNQDAFSIKESAELWYRLRACIRLLKLTLEQYQLDMSSILPSFEQLETQLSFIEKRQSFAQIVSETDSPVHKLADRARLQQLAHAELQRLSDQQILQSLWRTPSYGQLQLALVRLMFVFERRAVTVGPHRNIRSFANQLQEASWQRIAHIMPHQAALSSRDYQQAARALDESILVGFAYGQLYPERARDKFRGPWQDLVLGIRTLACYQLLSEISRDDGIDIEQWLQDKSCSLLAAMEHSRRSALAKEPYWR